jgi:hypothetical protein
MSFLSLVVKEFGFWRDLREDGRIREANRTIKSLHESIATVANRN